MRLILTAADQHNASVPFSTCHARLLESLVDRGFGDADNAAIIRAFEE